MMLPRIKYISQKNPAQTSYQYELARAAIDQFELNICLTSSKIQSVVANIEIC